MKNNQLICNLFPIIACSVGLASAGEVLELPKMAASTLHFDTHRVDAHAPIGVMGDHMHNKGEWMLSYRYMYMSMDGHRAGTNDLSTQEVYDRGFGSAATSMDMHMHMLGLMYAPSDRLTLMAMTNYVLKDMTMLIDPNAMMHGGGEMGGHGMGGSHSHSSEGFGDVTIGALYKVFEQDRQRVHLNLGIGLPTADVDHKDGGVFQPYGMQSGSGTWDLRLGATYLGQNDLLSWGAQVMGYMPLENENDSGFSLGDAANFTTWVAHPLNETFSLSARLNYTYIDAIKGHYKSGHNQGAPSHFQANYGGHVVDFGLGLNVLFHAGFLKGNRLAIEGLLPIYQNANGVGMDRDFAVTVGWQKSF